MSKVTIEISFAIIISVISLSFSIYMGIKGNKRTDTKDIEERAKERTELNVRLEFISKNTQEIKEQISDLKKDVQNQGERITKVEELAKRNQKETERLHERIDRLEEKANKEG